MSNKDQWGPPSERPWQMMRPRSDSEYSETPLRVFGEGEGDDEEDSQRGSRLRNNGRLIVIIAAVFLGLIIVVGSVIGFLQFTDIFEVKTHDSDPQPPDTHGIVYNCTTTLSLEVVYSLAGRVNCGNELPKTQTNSAPNVTFASADASTGYLLVMLDPDAPSRESPTRAPIRHWVVGNIVGAQFRHGSFGDRAVTLSTYRGPNPPNNTGLHRYGFFAFAQPQAEVTFAPLNASVANFDVVAFLQQYGVGSALAANFFVSQY